MLLRLDVDCLRPLVCWPTCRLISANAPSGATARVENRHDPDNPQHRQSFPSLLTGNGAGRDIALTDAGSSPQNGALRQKPPVLWGESRDVACCCAGIASTRWSSAFSLPVCHALGGRRSSHHCRSRLRSRRDDGSAQNSAVPIDAAPTNRTHPLALQLWILRLPFPGISRRALAHGSDKPDASAFRLISAELQQDTSDWNGRYESAGASSVAAVLGPSSISVICRRFLPSSRRYCCSPICNTM
jgi:hypothetical protein